MDFHVVISLFIISESRSSFILFTLEFFENFVYYPNWVIIIFIKNFHCVKSVQIRSYFWSLFSPNTGKYRPEISSKYFDTFDTLLTQLRLLNLMQSKMFCHSQPFKRQFHKMVKHTQIIGRQQGLAQK